MRQSQRDTIHDLTHKKKRKNQKHQKTKRKLTSANINKPKIELITTQRRIIFTKTGKTTKARNYTSTYVAKHTYIDTAVCVATKFYAPPIADSSPSCPFNRKFLTKWPTLPMSRSAKKNKKQPSASGMLAQLEKMAAPGKCTSGKRAEVVKDIASWM